MQISLFQKLINVKYKWRNFQEFKYNFKPLFKTAYCIVSDKLYLSILNESNVIIGPLQH